MTIQDLGSLSEVIAALATVITLIYLAIQIRHNTKATKDEATRSLMLANSEATMDVARDGELADIIQRGLHGHGDLTPTEQMRYNLFFFAYYNQVDYAYERFLEGHLNERSWNKIAKEIPVYIGAPGGKKWWASDKIRLSPEFVAYVESTLSEDAPSSVIPSVPAPNQD